MGVKPTHDLCLHAANHHAMIVKDGAHNLLPEMVGAFIAPVGCKNSSGRGGRRGWGLSWTRGQGWGSDRLAWASLIAALTDL